MAAPRTQDTWQLPEPRTHGRIHNTGHMIAPREPKTHGSILRTQDTWQHLTRHTSHFPITSPRTSADSTDWNGLTVKDRKQETVPQLKDIQPRLPQRSFQSLQPQSHVHLLEQTPAFCSPDLLAGQRHLPGDWLDWVMHSSLSSDIWLTLHPSVWAPEV